MGEIVFLSSYPNERRTADKLFKQVLRAPQT